MSVEQPRKKRQYSRNGCRDCKKRKLKCDESHPTCSQCMASNRTCIYEKLIKFNNSRIFTINANGEKLVNLKENKKNIEDNKIVQELKNASKSPGSIKKSPLNNNQFALENGTLTPFLDTLQHPELYKELLNDASSLINDLNELINSDSPFYFPDSNDLMLAKDYNNNNINSNDNDDDFLIHDPVIPKQFANNKLEDFKILNVLEKSLTQSDLVNISNFFQLNISSSHINYLKTFITHVHINLMPFSTAYLHNAFINNILIQAKKSPYLLSAILAISARYEYYQLLNKKEYKNSNLKVHGKLRSYYLSSCLNSLDSVLRKKR